VNYLDYDREENPVISYWLKKDRFRSKSDVSRWAERHGLSTKKVYETDEFYVLPVMSPEKAKHLGKNKIFSKYISDSVMIRFTPSKRRIRNTDYVNKYGYVEEIDDDIVVTVKYNETDPKYNKEWDYHIIVENKKTGEVLENYLNGNESMKDDMVKSFIRNLIRNPCGRKVRI